MTETDEAYNPGKLPEMLSLYYKRVFPFGPFYRWLSYGNVDSRDFSNREFSFTLQDDVYIRFQSFKSQDEMEEAIIKLNPYKIDIGAIFSYPPNINKQYSAKMDPVFRELVFDIDISDYDDVRSCCQGADVCIKCWKFMAIACRILDTALRDDFGFNYLLWVFSGRRGIHCWVCDDSARKLSGPERSAVAEYLQLISGGSSKKKLKLSFIDMLHPSVERAVDIIRSQFVDACVIGQGLLQKPESLNAILSLIPDETLRDTVHNKIKMCSNDEEKWEVVVNELSNYSVKLSDDSEKLSDDCEKLSDYSEKLSDDCGKLSDYSEKLSDDCGKLSDDCEKLSDYSEKLSDDCGKLSDDCEKLSDDCEKLSYYGVKLSDDCDKLSDDCEKLSYYGVKLSDDCDKLSDDCEKLSYYGVKLSDDCEKLADDCEKLSDDCEKLADDSENLADDSEKLADDSDEDHETRQWLLEKIMIQCAYPRLDINVTKGLNHLLKSPFCVHPKTGKISVPFDPSEVDKFDPDTVPTIAEVVKEINEYDTELKEHQPEEEMNKDGVKDYTKTSLNKSIQIFEEFVRRLEETWKEKKSKLQEMGATLDF